SRARRARGAEEARLAQRTAPRARVARALRPGRRRSPARGRRGGPRRHERARRAPRDARGAHDRGPRGRGARGRDAARGGAPVPSVRDAAEPIVGTDPRWRDHFATLMLVVVSLKRNLISTPASPPRRSLA